MASRIEQKERARAERLAAEEAARKGDRRRAAVMRLGLVLGLAVVVVIAAVVISSGGGKDAPPTGGSGGDAKATAALFRGIPQKGLTLGDPKAPATLIEFADLQCPFCGEYSNQALPTVVQRYVRTGRMRYELHIRSFLGSDSVRAAGAAAIATQENRLYQFADLFYRRQKEENTGYVTDAFVRGIAQGAGVDPAKAAAAAGDAQSRPLVGEAEALAKRLGSTSTPSFYLRLRGGRLVPVSPSELTGDAMSQALDRVLPKT